MMEHHGMASKNADMSMFSCFHVDNVPENIDYCGKPVHNALKACGMGVRWARGGYVGLWKNRRPSLQMRYGTHCAAPPLWVTPWIR